MLSPDERLASHILLRHPELAGKGMTHNETRGSMELDFKHTDEDGESTSLQYYVEYRNDDTPVLNLDLPLPGCKQLHCACNGIGTAVWAGRSMP